MKRGAAWGGSILATESLEELVLVNGDGRHGDSESSMPLRNGMWVVLRLICERAGQPGKSGWSTAARCERAIESQEICVVPGGVWLGLAGRSTGTLVSVRSAAERK